MELLLVIIIFLLLVILYRIRERFGRLDAEIRSLKDTLEHLVDTQDLPLAKAEEEEVKEFIPSEILPEAPLVVEKRKEEIPVTSSPSLSPSRPKKAKKKINYEKFIGENLFGKIGILILVVGVGLFVKYAIDQNWINEVLRTVLGFVSGTALLFFAERACRKYRTFSSLLAGGAFAVYYLTVAIAFHSYQLFSQPVAFIILVVITVLMSLLSVLYDRRELAIVSLIGGFIAPFLVSTGTSSYMVLFVYMAILNLGMFGLSLYKKWNELPSIAFAFTYLVFFWYVWCHFVLGALPEEEVKRMSTHLFWFATLFYFIFLLPIYSILKTGEKKYKLLVLATVANNLFYMGLGACFLSGMDLSFKAGGMLSLFIAAVNLGVVAWLRRSKEKESFVFYTFIALAVTFVSLAVPIQLEGNYITLCWAAEFVLLVWFFAKSGVRVYEAGALLLLIATFFSFWAGIYTGKYYSVEDGSIFLNGCFATNLFLGLAIGASAVIMSRCRERFEEARLLKYASWNALLYAVAAGVIYYAFVSDFCFFLDEAVVSKVILLFTSVYLPVANYGFSRRFPISKHSLLYLVAISINVVFYLLVMPGEATMNMDGVSSLLLWGATLAIIAHLYYVGRLFYSAGKISTRSIVYWNVLATLFWLAIIHLFLCQLGMPDEFNAGFSIGLAVAGFVQMALGMRWHQKVLRIISLFTFGVALLKLVLVDLWAMPTVGKIITFIILGVILLVLSFLYQKLKDVLFKDKC